MLNQCTDQTADVLVTEFFSRFGFPRLLHSDQGPNFESQLFASMCKLLEIEKTCTIPYRPQCDGQVERDNQSLQTMLKAFVNENRDN